mmetsp:Transcript_37584/g.74654  ORF Transcript_37584/g.74654 Transcript_37584/m.74654 type:complete len:222 (-) Transcript_37584:740-1405(-)
MPNSTMPTNTNSVQSLSVRIAVASRPVSSSIVQESASLLFARVTSSRVASQGGHCSCGHDSQASKIASESCHQRGKQQPWSIGPRPCGFPVRIRSRFPLCRSMLKTRISRTASASAASWETNSHARSKLRGIAKSSMKPMTSSTNPWTDPASSSLSTVIVARDVTGTPACEPAKRSTRYTASSRIAPEPASRLLRLNFSPSIGLNTAIFRPPTSKAYTLPV